MDSTTTGVTVIGGGLAGCEAAFQLAIRGHAVTLVEMRPIASSPAHHTDLLGELVCSNSLKSDDVGTAAGMLKRELESLGSLVMAAARASRVPAGGALAVDRVEFARLLTAVLSATPGVRIERREADAIPDGAVVVATGPLTSPALEAALSEVVGEGRLAFFDAAAPVVEAASIDMTVAFAQSRYDKGEGADYLNCPMERDEYEAFVDALLEARRVTAKDFESAELFQACQPVEEIARRGRDALRFGAMKPVGLTDPRTGRRPWAVVQLRPEDREGSAYNLVGFQTNLAFGEQQRVFRAIPGLADAEFARFGVMHRNTFVDAPRMLTVDLALREHPRIRLAGQLTGTEGYLEAAAGGLVAALGLHAAERGGQPVALPRETALGALLHHATDPGTDPYQPMHVNFGIVPPLEGRRLSKRERYAAYSARGAAALDSWVAERGEELGLAHARAAARAACAASGAEAPR